MPLLCSTYPAERRQSRQSEIAKLAILTRAMEHSSVKELKDTLGRTLPNGTTSSPQPEQGEFKKPPTATADHGPIHALSHPTPRSSSLSQAMNDTPATTAPNSPRFLPKRQNSGSNTPRIRPTTLDIPGLTKSKVSPDGRIASRDVGSKLVIVMVGLPARGKSYITKKLARYLNWLQHDTKIFNVGERRRVAAGGPSRTGTLDKKRDSAVDNPVTAMTPGALLAQKQRQKSFPTPAAIMLNGEHALSPPGTPVVNPQNPLRTHSDEDAESAVIDEPHQLPETEQLDQSASFFDPTNKKAALIREQVAMETLDELLDYILDGNGSVGILDATNSTLERRKAVTRRIRERAGEELNVLFLESRCINEHILESNMRLKLSGPDYKDKDPVAALEDFKKRVKLYEKSYIPLGDYEEENDMPYIQMIDVGRKIISHQIKGFLMAQANYYLLNFNLAARQIWITRHGMSEDNVSGKIGGDSALAPEGQAYARSLAKFMDVQRKEWEVRQHHKLVHSHFPPQPGDTTPPIPHYTGNSLQPFSPTSNPGDESPPELPQKPFCVWTSMLKRSIQTAQYFDDEEYDMKQMRMLDELNAGIMEGLTYNSIAKTYPDEYRLRKADKLHYRYPGPGGEGYLDIINRLRPVIVELERMTDHCLLVGHRSVARVLLAYFRGLKREEVADLDVPIGILYCLEPKPYGVEFKAYRWDKEREWFYEEPGFSMRRDEKDMQ
ncbi:6-phosphofructo-2-kinase-domain-containing protein [Elsinoe ampelina]|uniref:6-phosphofructo-2-kinase-domain-containing protein n=1 Tax=Elsinoe ampelina TaxID=302913 RepID=A0A6A6G1M5_9PEZI|nr:6-phosphofructo-2-kinase-domain-containing protein [Elsinoe ampelina]